MARTKRIEKPRTMDNGWYYLIMYMMGLFYGIARINWHSVGDETLAGIKAFLSGIWVAGGAYFFNKIFIVRLEKKKWFQRVTFWKKRGNDRKDGEPPTSETNQM